MSEPKLHRILQITFIAIIVGLVVPALVVIANGNRAFGKYWRGVSAMYDGRYETARRDIEWYVGKRPQDRGAWWELTRVRFFTGDYRGALEAWLVLTEPRRGRTGRILNYMRAMAAGEQPMGMRPSFLRPVGSFPKEFWRAESAMRDARYRYAEYAEVARLFEACVDRMPDAAGRTDALWGAAIAWFHAGELDACVESLELIEAAWGKEPCAPFKAVKEYVHGAALGEVPEADVPSVLKDYAPYSVAQGAVRPAKHRSTADGRE